VSGLVPVIGLPLPLMSRGGTSILTLFVGFGMLMSISAGGRRPVT
jgi:rod shape determining protein RodA